MSPPPGCRVKYAWNVESNLVPPILFHVVVLSEALGHSLYCDTVVMSMSNFACHVKY